MFGGHKQGNTLIKKHARETHFSVFARVHGEDARSSVVECCPFDFAFQVYYAYDCLFQCELEGAFLVLLRTDRLKGLNVVICWNSRTVDVGIVAWQRRTIPKRITLAAQARCRLVVGTPAKCAIASCQT